MALLPVLEFPDPRLRTRAQPVVEFGPELQQLIANMLETMYQAPGIGLAATQVNVHRQLIVMDIGGSAEERQPQVYINPQILTRDGAEVSEEGCLSVPNIFEEIERAARIRVRARDAQGQIFERDLEGIAAVCLQHEMDHLAGKLFVDYLSGLKRERIRRKLEKERRERASGISKAPARSAAARVI